MMLLVLMTLLVAGCAGSGARDLSSVIAAGMVPVPSDITQCRTPAVRVPKGPLNAGQVEKLWSSDRIRLAKVNRCLTRSINLYRETKAGLKKALRN